MKKFETYKHPRVASALLKLAANKSSYGLYEAIVVHLFETKGCDAVKLIIKGIPLGTRELIGSCV